MYFTKTSQDCWVLREEARESWYHVVSNKLIYLFEPESGNLESGFNIAERYIQADSWFEIHFTCPSYAQGESHFNAIFEVDKMSFPRRGKRNLKQIVTKRNGSMLVECPQFIKLPKGVVAIRISSMVRLKQVHDRCHCGWEEGEALNAGGVIVRENRKVDVPLLFRRKGSDRGQVRQSPRELVEGRSEAAYEITQEHGDDGRERLKLNTPDLEGILEIVFVRDGIGFAVNPEVEPLFKRIEVMLRPVGFHFDINQVVHGRPLSAHPIAEVISCPV